MYEPGNENAQDQYHQRRFAERFCKRHSTKGRYTVSLSRGIIDKLDDQELEAVIAHELSHIRNKDVRLMIVSIVFVGIFAMLAQMAMRSVYYSSMSRRRDEKNNTAIIIVLVMVVASHRLFLLHADAFRHLAQTGIPGRRRSCEMTKNPLASPAHCGKYRPIPTSKPSNEKT